MCAHELGWSGQFYRLIVFEIPVAMTAYCLFLKSTAQLLRQLSGLRAGSWRLASLWGRQQGIRADQLAEIEVEFV